MHRSFRFPAIWPAAALLVGLAFCGCDSQSHVEGTVTLDGQPVTSGSITFVQEAGESLVREGAVIQDGRFQAELPPGTYKLELTGQKVIGKRVQKGFDGKDEEVVQTDELFPARFNTKTELTETIKPGAHPLKLDLKSKP